MRFRAENKPRVLNHSAIAHFVGVLRKVPNKTWRFDVIADMLEEDDGRFANDLTMMEMLATLDPHCGAVGCAIGHSLAAFPQLNATGDVEDALGEILGIPDRDLGYLCGTAGPIRPVYGTTDYDKVSQFDVANAFERYAAEGKWWSEE